MALRAGRAAQPRPERNVVAHRQPRVEVGLLENHAARRRRATHRAARRPDDDHELAVVDREVDVAYVGGVEARDTLGALGFEARAVTGTTLATTLTGDVDVCSSPATSTWRTSRLRTRAALDASGWWASNAAGTNGQGAAAGQASVVPGARLRRQRARPVRDEPDLPAAPEGPPAATRTRAALDERAGRHTGGLTVTPARPRTPSVQGLVVTISAAP